MDYRNRPLRAHLGSIRLRPLGGKLPAASTGRECGVSVWSRFRRPEYVLNPRAVASRLRGGRVSDESEQRTVLTSWGHQITVFPDQLGRTIELTGVFDLCLTEAIQRLVDPGEVALDVGANVGYITSLMAARAGSEGRVLAFEPEPHVYALLERNALRWNTDRDTAQVETSRIALSNRGGTGVLESPGTPETHMGLSSLREPGERSASAQFEVELARLDDVLGSLDPTFLKLDVEGHEREVLEGAEQSLSKGRIRDIVFEEHGVYPAPSMTFLQEQGMTLFTLGQAFFGLHVQPIENGPAPPAWPGPNYLATLEPERALKRLRPRGWQSLGGLASFGRSGASARS